MTRNYLSILAETIRTNWDQPALTDFYLTEDGTAQDTSRGNHYTYGEMYAEICRVAELLTSLGLQKGDHIAICGTNSAHWVVAYLAIAKMQGVSVTVMHSLMPDEIARLVDFSDAKALFTDEDLWSELKSQSVPQVENIISLENFESLASGTSIIVSSASSPSSVSSASSPSIVGFPQSNPDSLAMICFTSGTTGVSKGVMLSYRACNHGVDVSLKTLPNKQKGNYLSLLPYSHISGLFVDVIDQLLKVSHVYINQNSLYSENAIEIVNPYILTVVPLYLEFLFQKHEIPFGGTAIQQVNIGGAKISELLGESLSKSQTTHVLLYAATEGLLFSNTSPRTIYETNVGKACRGIQIRIASNGEILVKGENVMLGYYKDPEATARKIDQDGWLHTGDKGHLDEDGYLYVEGRLEQDMIVLPNGENIHPEDIECKINALPEVSESIVLARDGRLVAIVVPSSEYRETSETIETRASSPSTSLRRTILRAVNPQLPLFSQLYDVEITDTPLAKTEKQTIKRYLYK